MATRLLKIDFSSNNSKEIIKFNGVSIFDDITNEPVLKKLTFSINKGEKVGILSDKTTPVSAIFDFLLQFNLKSEGETYINNDKIETIELKSLRSQIFYLSKKIPIFNTTLKKNIHPSFPKTLNTEQYLFTLDILQKFNFENNHLSDLGLNLQLNSSSVSPDERTAIGMARLILEKKKICLLDRVDVRFDNNGIYNFSGLLKEELSDSSVIMICERASTILECFDRVLIFEKGELVEVGNPKELNEIKESK